MASEEPHTPPTGAEPAPRVIKRYSNRKLYDTCDSRYVTLQQIGEMVRRGEHVQIVDNKTKEDKTEVTLALILSEDLKNKPRSVPLGTLRTLIQERSNRVLDSLRESPLGRLIPAGDRDDEGDDLDSIPPPSEVVPTPAVDKSEKDDEKKRGRLNELVETSRRNLDQLQATLDERIAAIVPGVAPIRELRARVTELTRRVEELEKRLGVPPSVPPSDSEQ